MFWYAWEMIDCCLYCIAYQTEAGNNLEIMNLTDKEAVS